MGLAKPLGDLAFQYNSTYNIVLDVSGWDKVGIQAVSPMVGAINVYHTNDSGAIQGETQGNASLATNFNTAQVTNLATGSAVTAISGAGNYNYDVKAQFLKLQGNPQGAGASVYKLLIFNSKIG